MDRFVYRGGELFVEDVPVRAIAAEAGTPCFVYSRATLEEHSKPTSPLASSLKC
jgi:diaminopimelate decarboxylase